MQIPTKADSGKKIRTGIMALATVFLVASSILGSVTWADDSGLPDSGFENVQARTALLVANPQSNPA